MQIEKIGVGMRLWDSHSGDHCRVIKINAKTVGVQFEESGVKANLPPARLETMLFPAQERIKAGDKVRLMVRLGGRAQGLNGTAEVDYGAKLRVLFDGDKHSVMIRRKELLPVQEGEMVAAPSDGLATRMDAMKPISELYTEDEARAIELMGHMPVTFDEWLENHVSQFRNMKKELVKLSDDMAKLRSAVRDLIMTGAADGSGSLTVSEEYADEIIEM